FRVLPPAFLCAMAGASSGADAGDFHVGVPLPVTLPAQVVLPTPELDDADLAAAIVRDHLPGDLAALHVGRADGHVVAVRHQQYLVENHFVAGVGVEQLETYHLAFRHPVLLATAGENRKHNPHSLYIWYWVYSPHS